MAQKIPKDALPAGSVLTNPAGKFHNYAETEVNTNPFSDPELIYRAEIDTDHTMHPTEGFVVPEFFSNPPCE